MIKKLLTLSVAALILVGCGKKKVTENMLVGSWVCNQQNLYDVENTSKDHRNHEMNDILIKYEKNGDAMTLQYHNLPPEKFTFIRLDERPYGNVDSQIENQRVYEYIYVSDNEFKYVDTSLYRNRQTKEHQKLNISTLTCIRQNVN